MVLLHYLVVIKEFFEIKSTCTDLVLLILIFYSFEPYLQMVQVDAFMKSSCDVKITVSSTKVSVTISNSFLITYFYLLQSYLSNRQFWVKSNEIQRLSVQSGVPQGSFFGPLLVYIAVDQCLPCGTPDWTESRWISLRLTQNCLLLRCDCSK